MNDTAKTKNQEQEKNGFFNVLRKPQDFFSGKKKEERKIICRPDITKQMKEGVIRLYKDLAPNEKTKPIDVTLIVEEGFQIFEEVLGREEFIRLKKYYGIGYKKNTGVLKPVELRTILTRLRTVENAQYYIHGYKDLLVGMTAKLKGVPEGIPNVVKAKIVRMFYTIFVGYYYFAHDFKYLYDPFNKMGKIVVDYEEAIKNNNKYLYPEDLYVINTRLIMHCPENTLSYDAIMYELEQIRRDQDLFAEVLKFAELGIDENGKFVSVNENGNDKTFSRIRKLKMRVHPEIGVYPIETFACEDQMKQAAFDSLYKLQKLLKAHKLEDFRVYEKEDVYLEEARIVKKMRKFYEIEESDDPNDEYGFSISGEAEKNRFIHMIDYIVEQGFILRASDGRVCETAIYMPALNFCEEMGYSNMETSLEKQFEIAEKIIALDKDGAINRFGRKEITKEELRKHLGIDEKFEIEELGILPKVCEEPEEIAIQFAINNGYVESVDDINLEMVNKIFISGNEETLKKFAAGEITEENFKKRVGFEDEFAEMYFDLKKVDVDQIESLLQELKKSLAKSDRMKKHTLLIRLYCYLIDGKVKCGPKNKVPKGNKGLKTSNLKNLIAAA